MNLGIGASWALVSDWELTTELDYHTQPTSSLDGVRGTSGSGSLLGGPYDTYMTFNVGVLYRFASGEKSRLCELYDGINVDIPDPIDYERVENIVEKHIPKTVEKQVVVEKEAKRKWVLIGVNFKFNRTTLRPEAYPILFHAVQVLLMNSEMKVEIQGHTDSIGSEQYNMKLSEKRAQAVKDYLVAHGIAPNRLTVRGFGETQPIADNSTAAGRQANRRVEFKTID